MLNDTQFEYKVLPLPTRTFGWWRAIFRRNKGFSTDLEALLNTQAKDGWVLFRNESFHIAERNFGFKKRTVVRNTLIFQRALATLETAKPVNTEADAQIANPTGKKKTAKISVFQSPERESA